MVKGYLTIQDVAKELGVDPESVRRYIRNGKLNAKKVVEKGLKKIWGVLPDDLKKFQGK